MGREKFLYCNIRAEESLVMTAMTKADGNCQWYGAGLASVFLLHGNKEAVQYMM